MSTTTTIKGSAKLVIESLGKLPDAVTRAAARGLARGLLYAVGIAQRNFLSGPRPGKLDVRTRRLRDSVVSEVLIDRTVRALEWLNGKTTEVIAGNGDVTGRMGSNVTYAAFHEFGFHGVIHVGAHSRVVSTLDVSGKRIDQRGKYVDREGNFIGYKESHGSAAGKSSSKAAFVFTTTVRAHDRRVNYDGRPYIRPALENCLEEIAGEIGNELKGVSTS